MQVVEQLLLCVALAALRNQEKVENIFFLPPISLGQQEQHITATAHRPARRIAADPRIGGLIWSELARKLRATALWAKHCYVPDPPSRSIPPITDGTAPRHCEQPDPPSFIQGSSGGNGSCWAGAVLGAVADIDCSDCSRKKRKQQKNFLPFSIFLGAVGAVYISDCSEDCSDPKRSAASIKNLYKG